MEKKRFDKTQKITFETKSKKLWLFKMFETVKNRQEI